MSSFDKHLQDANETVRDSNIVLKEIADPQSLGFVPLEPIEVMRADTFEYDNVAFISPDKGLISQNDGATSQTGIDNFESLPASVKQYIKDLESQNEAKDARIFELTRAAGSRDAFNAISEAEREQGGQHENIDSMTTREDKDAADDDANAEILSLYKYSLPFDLLERLKGIWQELMRIYITEDCPDLSPIQDIEFIVSQIEISCEIVKSYIDNKKNEIAKGFSSNSDRRDFSRDSNRVDQLQAETRALLGNLSRRGSQI